MLSLLHLRRSDSTLKSETISTSVAAEQSKQRCRIGFVSDAIYPFSIGGRERRLWEIARRLGMSGIEVHIYTMKWWSGGKTLTVDGVQLHAICRRRSLYHGGRRSIVQALIFGLATLKLAVARFDVLDVDHMPYFPIFAARIVCVLRRKQMVVTWHEVWGSSYWQKYLGRLAPISTITERLAAHVPDKIVAVSRQTSTRLIDQLGVKAAVRTIELGVDLAAIRTEQKSKLRSDILFAGRLLAHKNVDILLRAVAEMREDHPWLCCRVVGEGPERRWLERLSRELGLEGNVIFHDFFPGSEIYGVMKAATVFALPSIREGFGIVVLEANSCGLPVVTVDHPDNAARHLITDGQNGFLANVDTASLAEALSVAMIRAPLMDPQAGAECSGHLRDWDEVATSVYHAVTHGQWALPDGRLSGRQKVTELA
jgi:glycosyltransferase involved in cell wall biosynthesis